jgi:uncharacterized protein (TIGR00290 family)
MHGLRAELLQQQIEAICIPGMTVELPEQPTNAEYEFLLKEKVNELLKQGYHCAAFGDIFLEDLKSYREKQLEPYGIKSVFPLWKKDSKALLTQFIDLGFKAITVCVDGSKLNSSFAGRLIDHSFITDLPNGVDICGENGEFHTFCYDGPYFKQPVNFTKGEIVMREYDTNGFKSKYWFCDLVPG